MRDAISGRLMSACLILFIIALCTAMDSTPAYGAETGKAIASLTSFSGTVLIKSRGEWGAEPFEGMPLYTEDKIVTRTGIAAITFDDGAVMNIKANSNLLIRETEETTGLTGGIGTVKRQLRLLVGKMLFRSGKGSGTRTTLETTTMVCGLRGTAGTLSIDAAGVTYLQFIEGGGDTVGSFITGIAPDVPAELAELNDAQRAAITAAAAAQQARQAARRLASGEVTDSEVELAAVEAAKAAAEEAKAAAEAMLNSPDPNIREEAAAVIVIADRTIETAQEIIDTFMNGGDDDAVLGDSYGVLGDYLTRLVYSPAVQGLESEILLSGDLVPPVVDVIGSPSAFNNLTTAEFTFSVDEYVVYYYSLDGGALINAGYGEAGELSFTLSGLTEGAHILELVVLDTSGNETALGFSWTTDLTAPAVALSVSPGETTTLMAILNNIEPGAVSYLFTDAATGNVIPPSGFSDGTYSVNVTATDQAGNASTTTFDFTLYNAPISGDVAGKGSVITGTASGMASIIEDRDWGGWVNDMSGEWSGTHGGTLSLTAGGDVSSETFYGEWISLTSGTIDTTTGEATGATDFIMINDTSLTKGIGTFTGSFDSDGTWSGIETGTGLTNEPLAFAGNWSSYSFYDYGDELPDAGNYSTGSYGYVGLVDRGSYYDYVLMGPYLNPYTGGPYLTLSYIYDYDETDSEYDYPGVSGAIWDNGKFKGVLAATYDTEDGDTAGIFYTKLSGNYYEMSMDYYSGMWLSRGEITPVVLITGISSSGRYVDHTNTDLHDIYVTDYWGEGSPYLDSVSYSTDNGNGISNRTIIMNQDGSIDMVYGAWALGLTSGGYSNSTPPSDGWELLLEDGYDRNSGDMIGGYFEIGDTGDSTWDWSTNEISADVAGSWVDLTELATGIYGGKLAGTFDPDTYVWQAVAAGALIDTNTFLEMAATTDGQAKLAQLDIPCIEVGATTLSGDAPGGAGVAWDVTMTDVKFFAYSSDVAPKIWATGDVTGTVYDSAYLTGNTATLSGTGFTGVSFQMDAYSEGSGWVAGVDGSGTVDGHSVHMLGNAAGTDAGAGSFSGTASGITEEND